MPPSSSRILHEPLTYSSWTPHLPSPTPITHKQLRISINYIIQYYDKRYSKRNLPIYNIVYLIIVIPSSNSLSLIALLPYWCELREHKVRICRTSGAVFIYYWCEFAEHLLFSPLSSSFLALLILSRLSFSLPTPFLPTRYIRISKYLHTQISLYLSPFIFRYLHTPILTYLHSSLFKSSNTSQYLNICISLNIQILLFKTGYFYRIIYIYIQISRPMQV